MVLSGWHVVLQLFADESMSDDRGNLTLFMALSVKKVLCC